MLIEIDLIIAGADERFTCGRSCPSDRERAVEERFLLLSKHFSRFLRYQIGAEL